MESKDILVVADAPIEPVVDEIRRRLDRHSEVHVVAPALASSGLKHLLGDIDDAIESAKARLGRSLTALKRAGIDAHGEVGDSDPLVAIGDELQTFDADEVLVVAHEPASAAYAERGLLKRASGAPGPPVIELRVGEEIDSRQQSV